MGIKQQIEDNSRLYGNTYVYKGEVLDSTHLIVYVNGNREEDEVSRLTEIAAQKATRCDELYEALEDAADLLFQSNDKELRDYGMTIRKLLKETKK